MGFQNILVTIIEEEPIFSIIILYLINITKAYSKKIKIKNT